ncbi:hypothetical protein MMC08_000307 [Hypocenomyce scalaris]|nr:hypothetical protein [Hypocenomyce scalaris]
MSNPQFSTQPPSTSFTKISFPTPRILLVTLSRPKQLNCINTAGHKELGALWAWLDNEPSLRVGIITGEGRAFCAGADLKEWNDSQTDSTRRSAIPSSGFGGLSRRSGKKPIIAAVNGICFGGGFEMTINVDLVLASHTATFGLPEVKRGVVALAGALPRLVRTVGKQRAMELCLTGRVLEANEAKEWGLVNAVVGERESVVAKAVVWAEVISENSPDSVIVSREGVKLGWEGMGADEGSEWLIKGIYPRIDAGENMKEGVKAFVEKRAPRWVPSKL